MEHDRRTLDAGDRVRAIFALYRVDRQLCVKVAFLVREDCQAGTAKPIDIQLIGCTSKTAKKVHPHDLLDKAISVLKHIPDGQEKKVMEYAYGQFRGRPSGVVHRFLRRVPADAWVDIAPVAAELV